MAKNGTQHVTLDLDEKCNCGNCTLTTWAYVRAIQPNTIWLCPSGAASGHLRGILKHELIHALALRFDHLPCATHAVMTLQFACHDDQTTYTTDDRDYLCSTRATDGGVCH